MKEDKILRKFGTNIDSLEGNFSVAPKLSHHAKQRMKERGIRFDDKEFNRCSVLNKGKTVVVTVLPRHWKSTKKPHSQVQHKKPHSQVQNKKPHSQVQNKKPHSQVQHKKPIIHLSQKKSSKKTKIPETKKTRKKKK